MLVYYESMYQKINEVISVLGVYSKSGLIPKKFKWNERVFQINQITLSNEVRDGSIYKRLYSVVSGSEVYRLEFNRTTEQWRLLEVWVE